MQTKRIKSLSYDDDDGYDDYEEEEYENGEGELTEDDKRQLAAGTQRVREVLGDAVQITDAEIQDSLWHYYYDVDKTVNYILNQKTAAETKAAKQAEHKKAQDSKAASKPKASAKSADMPKPGSKKDADSKLSNGMGKLAVSDAPRVKSKNLDVLAEHAKAERKNALNFVVIGHVDAGKSTLMGRLLLDLGVYDQRLLAKNQKEADQIGKGSFALAWMMDQGSEERERGVTIDIAQNKFETSSTVFTILDAPGHRDFIPNMIAGAAQADFAVLVIDASTGSFESGMKGQTKEHALLVRSLGVTRLLVAVNKLDSQSWSEERFNEITGQLGAFLATAGFSTKTITFVPCSGLTGENVTKRAEDEAASWYKGPILLEALEQSEPITRSLKGPLRLSIADVFRGGIQNPLSVSGRIESGSLQVGDKLLVVPSNETAYIRAVEVDQEPADYAVAGQNVVLHLGEIDPSYLKIGDVLCDPEQPLPVIKSFLIKVLAFEHIMPMQLDVHRGRLHVQARVAGLKALLDKNSGKVTKKTPKIVKPGEVARLHILIEDGVGLPLEKGMRIVLRSGGETLATGLVEKDLDASS